MTIPDTVLHRYAAGETARSLEAAFRLPRGSVQHVANRRGIYSLSRGATQASLRQDCEAICTVWADRLARAGVDVRPRGRRQPIARARQALMLALVRDGHSTPLIGLALGGLDHTTVLHGIRTAEACPAASQLAACLPGASLAELREAIARLPRTRPRKPRRPRSQA